jgi:RTX calcium-binding nonapeptide repeat (4 copies)
MFNARFRRVGALAFALGMLLWPAVAQATTITVDSTADNLAGCTLRNAITAANLNAPEGTCPAGQPGTTVDTINFSVPSGSTITLGSALPAIDGAVNITGPGKSQLTVSGADAYQPFKVNSGKTVSISGLTISHGKCDSAACNFNGGAIWNNGGTLTLSGVAVTQSSTTGEGGGVSNAGTMTIQNSTVSGNTASVAGGTNAFPEGGGIFNAGTMQLVLSTVTGNSATATAGTNESFPLGGGIYNSGAGELTIDRSTISSNDASADAMGGNEARAAGAAINNRHNLTITRSTVSGNTASATGGAAFNTAANGGISNVNPASPADVTVTLDRTTLSDNTASASGTGAQSTAGGMSILPGTYTITSSTIAHNSAGFYANLAIGGTPIFKNTIVADPAGGGTNCNGTPQASSYSLSSDGTCGFTGTGDHLNTDPQLAATLAANGGPTKTYALLDGSPAIDKGKASAGETFDQRGKKRPSDFGNIPNAAGGDGSDIGAFEVQDTTPPDTIIDSGPTGTTNDPTPTFAFHSTEAGSTFQCKVDGGAYAACTSPKTTVHLGDGSHSFQVRAKDLAGNIDASPASRSFTVKTAAVSRSGTTLVVTAAPGATDNVQITRPSASVIRITDLPSGSYTGSGVHPVSGSGCARSGDYTASCSAAGIARVQIASGGGTDRIVNATSLPSALFGGPANDVLTGGSANDTLTGGAGADSFKGMNGNDTLLAHDLASDKLINCDGGTKPGTADKADLDLLPKDPNSIVSGCETKTRH